MHPIRNITINHSSNQIFITRSIYISNEKSCLYPIPETINSDEIITVEDSVENGSTLFHFKKPEFPRDLELYKNQKFIFQTLNYGQIIGTFIEIDNKNKLQNKFILLDVEEVNNICNVKPFSKGKILLNENEISSFILCDPKSNIVETETCKSNAKLVINNTTISRAIFVTHSSKVNEESLGYYHHLIRDFEFNDLYTKQRLRPDIPLKVLTEFVWKPMFNIGDINYNTQESKVSLKIITKDEKYVYSVGNFKCLKNCETKIIINSFETTYNRAVLIHPMGPNQISIYFKNTSESLFTKSTIKLVNSYKKYIYDLYGEEKYQQIDYFNCETQPLELLNSVRPNSTGVMILKIPNEKIKICQEISHQPLFETRSKKTKIQRVKISKDLIFIDIKFKNKIEYQIVNSSQFKTKILIHFPNKEFKIKGIPNMEIIKDVGRNLYLLDSDELSINYLTLYSKKNEQIFTGPHFLNVLLKFLEKKGYIKIIGFDSKKFEIINFKYQNKIFHKDLSELLEKVYFEKSNSSYFEKQFSKMSLEESLFDTLLWRDHSLYGFSNQTKFFFDSNANSFYKSSSIDTFSNTNTISSTPSFLLHKKPESLYPPPIPVEDISNRKDNSGSSSPIPKPVGEETSNTNESSQENNKRSSDKKVTFCTSEPSLVNKSLFGSSSNQTTSVKIEPSLETISIFGKHSTLSTTESSVCTKPAIGSSPPSIFGQSPPNKTTSTTSESGLGESGSTRTTTSTKTSAFGGTSIFGIPLTPGSLSSTPTAGRFGSSSTHAFGGTSIFGIPLTPGSLSSTPTTGEFGSSSTHLYGSSSTKTISVFGNSPTPLFGAPTTTTGIFGSSSTTLYGSSPTTTTGLFGSSSTTLYGSSPTTTTGLFVSSSTPLYGSSPTTTGLFGSSSTTLYGSSPTTTTGLFGSSSTPLFDSASTTKTSLFGSSSIFGAKTTPKEEIKKESEYINENSCKLPDLVPHEDQVEDPDEDQVEDYDEDQVEDYDEDQVEN
ncbi:hypothetical protein ACTFIR_012486 [Dictyostelium discoideum]